ncbi:MAG: glycine betaine ABC transporter substrate-binding protein [Fibrobacterota bacterium]
MKKAVIFGAALLAAVLVIGCSQSKESGKSSAVPRSKSQDISILYPNWSEGIAMTNLAKVALEDMGYSVELTQLDPGPIYAALAKKRGDLFMDAWLPHTHADYWQKYGEDLVKIGKGFDNGTTGLVVPAYMDINSIADLNDRVDDFDGKIIGIGSGAGIHGNTEKAIDAYDLNYEQVTSSGAAMTAELKKAVMKEDPIVVTGWKPHYMWAKYDLKYLDDPKGVYPADACEIISRKGFSGDYPEATEFLSNFSLTEEQLYSLMGAVKEADDKTAAAQEWYENNQELVSAWMPAAE